MWPKSNWFLVALASLAALALWGAFHAGPPPAPSTPLPDPFAVEEGGRLYAHYCSPCHGESGKGDGRFYASSLEPTPPDFTAPAFANAHTDAQLAAAIAGGSASLGKSNLCPPWGKTFSSTEVEYLVVYIRALREK